MTCDHGVSVGSPWKGYPKGWRFWIARCLLIGAPCGCHFDITTYFQYGCRAHDPAYCGGGTEVEEKKRWQ